MDRRCTITENSEQLLASAIRTNGSVAWQEGDFGADIQYSFTAAAALSRNLSCRQQTLIELQMLRDYYCVKHDNRLDDRHEMRQYDNSMDLDNVSQAPLSRRYIQVKVSCFN